MRNLREVQKIREEQGDEGYMKALAEEGEKVKKEEAAEGIAQLEEAKQALEINLGEAKTLGEREVVEKCQKEIADIEKQIAELKGE